MRVSEERREWQKQKVFEEIMAEKFTNLMKNINLHIQEVQWRKRKTFTSRHITVIALRSREKVKNPKSSKRKKTHRIQGSPYKVRAGFTSETMDARKQWDNTLKGLKKSKIKLSPNSLISSRTIIQKWRQNKVIPCKQNRGFVSSSRTLLSKFLERHELPKMTSEEIIKIW